MNKKVLIVKNITREGPGIIEELLREGKIPYEIADLHKGESFPSPKNYAALVVLGGPDSANDKTQKIQKELERIKESLSLGLPYMGICLGLQVLVKSAGGKIMKSPVKEIGFRDPEEKLFTVRLTKEGRKDPLFLSLPDTFTVFHLHGETVNLTKNMKLLGVGKFCRNQIVKVGKNAYGIQSHFELTPKMFKVWIREDADLLELNKEELQRDFANIQEEYTKAGRTLFKNFLRIAGF
ncbi:MAG: type 1 glutamine amidotransferase [Candidatus Portnoybacteria bacterium]|nr:type 1 glutamine amidotransferase [Candidatus Portnoybacteria bacterium]